MEKPIPPILPEGFFRTTEEVYEEVANYPTVPPEKLYEYWQVYTTTFRRLEDPTASRLEAFWWHVMGSDRRFLSGKALAKMFEEISKGPSFTPLRGPPDRVHTSVPRIIQEQVENAGYGTKTQTEARQEPVDVPRRPTAEKHTSKDTMASSSSRPPPPHPILKKSRGPSTSGPRPTARFVSPPESEDDAAKENDTSSENTAATDMHMRRPAKSPVKGEKRATPTGRKFTASSAAKRHSRPGLTRRPSSQSSADANTKGASHAAGSGANAGSKSVPAEQSMTASLASSETSTLNNSPAMGAKVAGKRPLRSGSEKSRHTDRGDASGAQGRIQPVVVQREQETVPPPKQSIQQAARSSRKGHESGGEKIAGKAETTGSHLGVGSAAAQTEPSTAPMMARSQSNIEHQHHRARDFHLGRPLPPSMITPKSTPVAKKAADVAVQVQFDSENVTAQGGGVMDRDLPDSITIASRPSTSSLYMPTQPSPTPAPFLGRSKSQLTLLLEKMDQGKPKSKRDTRERG